MSSRFVLLGWSAETLSPDVGSWVVVVLSSVVARSTVVPAGVVVVSVVPTSSAPASLSVVLVSAVDPIGVVE